MWNDSEEVERENSIKIQPVTRTTKTAANRQPKQFKDRTRESDRGEREVK